MPHDGVEEPTAESHAEMAVACLAREELGQARRHGEAAYRLHGLAGSHSQAAAAALTVAQVHEWRGQAAAVEGWLRRAQRLLEKTGPCVEAGYFELAQAAAGVPDVGLLERRAGRAGVLGRRFQDSDLEMRAIADGGLAMVCQGRIEAGLDQLEAALAAAGSGKVRQGAVAGMICRSVLTAGERLQDPGRTDVWREQVDRLLRDHPPAPLSPVLSQCQIAGGWLMANAERWAEAEAEFRRACEITTHRPLQAGARGAIAALLIHQERFFEAEEALAGFEGRPEITPAVAMLMRERGELDLASEAIERYLLHAESDLLTSAPLLALHLELEIERGDLDMAATSSARLTWIAAETELEPMCRLAGRGAERVTAARVAAPFRRT